MAGLQFVAFSDDGKAVILQDENGEWIEVPITGASATPVPAPAVKVLAADLTPREIQSRIRAGISAEQLASESGAALERIMMFAPPILLERSHVAGKAGRTVVRRAGGSAPLADVVEARLEPLGVDLGLLNWDSFRREDGKWTVLLSYPSSEGPRVATWLFDLRNSAIVPADDEARWLTGEVLAKGETSHPSHPTLVSHRLSVVKDTETIAVPAISEPVEIVADDERPVDLFDDAIEPEPEPAGDEHIEQSEFDRQTKAEPDERKRSKLPSWDEILFGSKDD